MLSLSCFHCTILVCYIHTLATHALTILFPLHNTCVLHPYTSYTCSHYPVSIAQYLCITTLTSYTCSHYPVPIAQYLCITTLTSYTCSHYPVPIAQYLCITTLHTHYPLCQTREIHQSTCGLPLGLQRPQACPR